MPVDAGKMRLDRRQQRLLETWLPGARVVTAQQFRTDPALEAAFLEGYGGDPRAPDAWHRTRVREAIGTAVWAHQVGDGAFEKQGHRMVVEALGL